MYKKRQLILDRLNSDIRILYLIDKWERENIPFIKNSSARELYLMIAGIYLQDPYKFSSLKSYSTYLTPKIIHKQIREFEKLKLIKIVKLTSDRRSKYIFPRPKLIKIFLSHTNEIRKIISNYYYIKPI